MWHIENGWFMLKLNIKAQLINAMVAAALEESTDVVISRNDNIYKNGIINQSLYEMKDDVRNGIHLNETGSPVLANNT